VRKRTIRRRRIRRRRGGRETMSGMKRDAKWAIIS
jgi:hypothetical protein